MCNHANTEEVPYLNPCKFAGCQLNGPVTYHLNCGQQHKEVCSDCGAVLTDSANEPIEREDELYMCRQCEEDGIQSGHVHCGTTFSVPA